METMNLEYESALKNPLLSPTTGKLDRAKGFKRLVHVYIKDAISYFEKC